MTCRSTNGGFIRKPTQISSEVKQSAARSNKPKTRVVPKTKLSGKFSEKKSSVVMEKSRRATSSNPTVRTRFNEQIKETQIEKRRSRKDRKKVK